MRIPVNVGAGLRGGTDWKWGRALNRPPGYMFDLVMRKWGRALNRPPGYLINMKMKKRVPVTG
jgi:hypothetical protein